MAVFAVMAIAINPDYGANQKMKADIARMQHNGEVRNRFEPLTHKYDAELKRRNPDVARVNAYPVRAGDLDGPWEIGVYFDTPEALARAVVPAQLEGLDVKKKLYSTDFNSDLANAFPRSR